MKAFGRFECVDSPGKPAPRVEMAKTSVQFRSRGLRFMADSEDGMGSDGSLRHQRVLWKKPYSGQARIRSFPNAMAIYTKVSGQQITIPRCIHE
ncbi:uncharacterized protein LOC111481253 isoform X2 [Cucurbita maxima]|uniref:Uncharacterized protein LOC111481253 isoform X2 n=1 Tax=Cucurbita maxima TaxID=3661 RepID=A0A6J1J4I2_CUCMA|nr:uncharacterized protein LOC111481253 isoform X2 [Cucurbita maxima]